MHRKEAAAESSRDKHESSSHTHTHTHISFPTFTQTTYATKPSDGHLVATAHRPGSHMPTTATTGTDDGEWMDAWMQCLVVQMQKDVGERDACGRPPCLCSASCFARYDDDEGDICFAMKGGGCAGSRVSRQKTGGGGRGAAAAAAGWLLG